MTTGAPLRRGSADWEQRTPVGVRGGAHPECAVVSQLEVQLAAVAREIAALLTQPRYDEATLAELDVAARHLRERIREASPPVEKPERLIGYGVDGGRLLSGG